VRGTVRIPTVLAQVAGGATEVAVEADTVRGALDSLFVAYPQLRVHLFDESGEVRPHVALFHNGRTVRSDDRLAAPLADGDVVTVLQAVSGG